MNFFSCLRRLINEHTYSGGENPERTRAAIGDLLQAQGERTQAARSTKIAAYSNVRAYRAEGSRIKQRTALQAEKSGSGTTSYAKEQVSNLLEDMDRDVARAVRGDADEE